MKAALAGRKWFIFMVAPAEAAWRLYCENAENLLSVPENIPFFPDTGIFCDGYVYVLYVQRTLSIIKKEEKAVARTGKVAKFIIGVIYFLIFQMYPLVTLDMTIEEYRGGAILMFVVMNGALTSILIVGIIATALNRENMAGILTFIILLSILPFCVGFLSTRLPSVVYIILCILYIVLFGVVGVVPALGGIPIYLITCLFIQDSDTRAFIAAVIPSVIWGIFLGLRLKERKAWYD